MTASFYKKALKIAIPIALSQFFAGLLGVIDTLMVSQLGDNAIAAVGISSNITFLMFMVNWGLMSGFGIFIAQYYGSKDLLNIHKVFIVVLILASLIATLFFLAAFFAPAFLIGLYNNSDDLVNTVEVARFGEAYLRIASISFVTITFTQSLSMFMRSVGDVVFPQVMQIMVVFLNTGLNYLLINGNLGAPALGVQGAALATVSSSSVGLVLFIGYMIVNKNPVYRIRFAAYKLIDRPFIKRVFKKTMPVLLNETIWGLGMSMYLIAFGFISPMAVTSLTIANQVIGLIWFANGGLAAATAIMLGHKLGENALSEAKLYASRFVRMNLAIGVTIGGILFLLAPWIASLYEATSLEVQSNVIWFLRIFALYLPIKFMNALHIVGTLRSGGDTLFALFSEIGPLWGYGVPMVFILSLFTSAPLYLILILINVEEIIKITILTFRYRSYKWIRNLTIDPDLATVTL